MTGGLAAAPQRLRAVAVGLAATAVVSWAPWCGAGLPGGGASLPRGGGGLPRGGSGLPRGGAGVPRGGAGQPRGGAGLPRENAAQPRGSAGLHRGGAAAARPPAASAETQGPHLIVDGMNALGRLYKGGSGQQAFKAMYSHYPVRLVGALQALRLLRPELRGATVVFDQPRLQGRGGGLAAKAWARAARRTWACGGVEVQISPSSMGGELDRADRLLEGLVASRAGRAPLLVVTDDRALRASLERLGARCEGCRWLRRELQRDAGLVQEREQHVTMPSVLRRCFSVY
mmetsp:Transcript_6109/g.17442  ORF Transcript_6109/g.17442 Transcript_6109/m.17442 type:complete len:287 (+) Transcript_6109:68-928(+)